MSLVELKGLPNDILKKLEQVPDEPLFRMLSLSKTQIIPALKNIEDEKVREKL